MKRVIIISALTLFTLQLYAQESYWKVSQRAQYYGNEWNDLIKMQDELSNDAARIRLYAYRFGYAQAAQFICEGLRNVGMREFADMTDFFFQQFKSLETFFTENNLLIAVLFGEYAKYYHAGEARIIEQTRRYTISDFR